MAQAIANDVFRCGATGRMADRLALTEDSSGRDLGGWGYWPFVDRVERRLRILLTEESEAE